MTSKGVSQKPQWQAVQKHYESMKDVQMRDLCAAAPILLSTIDAGHQDNKALNSFERRKRGQDPFHVHQ